jgi:hypothetical protein
MVQSLALIPCLILGIEQKLGRVPLWYQGGPTENHSLSSALLGLPRM